MHEEEPRLLVQHVTMQGGHFDAVRPQRHDHRIDLVAGQHEVAGDGRLAVSGRLEIDGDCDAHRGDGGQQHAVFGYRVAPLHVELVDASVGLALDTDDLV